MSKEPWEFDYDDALREWGEQPWAIEHNQFDQDLEERRWSYEAQKDQTQKMSLDMAVKFVEMAMAEEFVMKHFKAEKSFFIELDKRCKRDGIEEFYEHPFYEEDPNISTSIVSSFEAWFIHKHARVYDRVSFGKLMELLKKISVGQIEKSELKNIRDLVANALNLR